MRSCAVQVRTRRTPVKNGSYKSPGTCLLYCGVSRVPCDKSCGECYVTIRVVRRLFHVMNENMILIPLLTDTCPFCQQSPHDTHHIFTCPPNPTTLGVSDLCERPAEVSDFLATLPFFRFRAPSRPPERTQVNDGNTHER